MRQFGELEAAIMAGSRPATTTGGARAGPGPADVTQAPA
jgi:hypothetical protein